MSHFSSVLVLILINTVLDLISAQASVSGHYGTLRQMTISTYILLVYLFAGLQELNLVSEYFSFPL